MNLSLSELDATLKNYLSFTDRPLVHYTLFIILISNLSHVMPNLPFTVSRYFRNTFMQILWISMICFLLTREPVMSILVAIIALTLIFVLNKIAGEGFAVSKKNKQEKEKVKVKQILEQKLEQREDFNGLDGMENPDLFSKENLQFLIEENHVENFQAGEPEGICAGDSEHSSF